MTFLDLVKKRQSDRSYLSTPVEREKIERALEAARLAPSACNSQPWYFIAVTDPELKNAIAERTTSPLIPINRFVPEAPVIVAVVTERPALSAQIGGFMKGKEFNLIDIGIAVEHFCLQAAEDGLGTCMLGWFDEKKVKKLLGLPRHKRVALLISVGYPKETNTRTKIRKAAEDTGEIR